MNVLLVSVTLVSLFIYNLVRNVVLFLTPRRFRKRKDITGQKVLITGAGSGLGRNLAIQFSKHSKCLVLLDINKEALYETSQALDPSAQVFLYKCDVTNRKTVYAIAQRIKDDVGDIDILVNNAGTVCGKSLIDLPDDKIVKTMEVNVISHFWTCKAFLPAMMAKNKGHIVSIASVLSHTTVPKLTDYCASKYAAAGFAESLEIELRLKNLDGIKVTIVCPGLIDTGLFDGFKVTIGGSFTAEHVAKEIVEGTLEEKETIFIPHYYALIPFIRSITPRWLHILFYELTDNIKAMNNFRGRAKLTDASSNENGRAHGN